MLIDFHLCINPKIKEFDVYKLVREPYFTSHWRTKVTQITQEYKNMKMWKCFQQFLSFALLFSQTTVLHLLEQNILKCSCHLFHASESRTVCFMINGGLSSDHVIKGIQHTFQPLITAYNLVFTFLSGYPAWPCWPKHFYCAG